MKNERNEALIPYLNRKAVFSSLVHFVISALALMFSLNDFTSILSVVVLWLEQKADIRSSMLKIAQLQVKESLGSDAAETPMAWRENMGFESWGEGLVMYNFLRSMGRRNAGRRRDGSSKIMREEAMILFRGRLVLVRCDGLLVEQIVFYSSSEGETKDSGTNCRPGKTEY